MTCPWNVHDREGKFLPVHKNLFKYTIHISYFLIAYAVLLSKNALHSLTNNIVGSIVADSWSLVKTAVTTISVLLLLLCTYVHM